MEHKDINNEEKEGGVTDASHAEPSHESAAPRGADIKISKKAFFLFAAVVMIILLGYYYRGTFIAATVNGGVISRLEVIHALEKASGKQALESLIVQKIITDEIKKSGVVVSQDEVDAEVKRIGDQFATQGGAFEAALKEQGITLADFSKQIKTQLEVEKILGEKILVTDAEVDEYIKTNKLNISADKLTLAKSQIADQLKREKMNKEGQALVSALREAAKVSIIVQY